MPRAPCLGCGSLNRHQGDCGVVKQRARRVRLAKTMRGPVIEDWVARYGWTCPGFRRGQHQVRRGGLQLDHVIPISMGGTDDLANLSVLCGPCNARKGASMDEKR